MPLLVDVHAHLDHTDFSKDIDAVIERARAAGVRAIIAQGVNHESNLAVLALAKKYDIVKAALGLYPLDALNVKVDEQHFSEEPSLPRTKVGVDATLNFIEQHNDSIIAIGEVGVDAKFSTDLAAQRENFQKIIKLSLRIKKPLIVHSRKAELDTIEMLEASKCKQAMMHCFGGKLKLAKRIEDNGWMVSIPPCVVRSSHFQELVKRVNINHLLTETDCPYLGPEPGKRNEPANVIESVKMIAQIKKMTVEDTANAIFHNYQTLFL
ncbi:TatD family hydrolase [Candidatus Woesearchaeota archaeon]|nr:TatD family hydrolase [Candidatus Woesearchaeota archaeon]